MTTLLKNLWDGSDYKIDLNVGNEILNNIDQKHQCPQTLKDPVSSRLAKLIRKYWNHEPSDTNTIKKLEENILILHSCHEIDVPKLNRETKHSNSSCEIQQVPGKNEEAMLQIPKG